MFSDTVVLSTYDTSTTQKIYSFNTVAEPITDLYLEARGSSPDWFIYLNYIALSNGIIKPLISDSFLTMLASENVLRRDWEGPEEDEAWADL